MQRTSIAGQISFGSDFSNKMREKIGAFMYYQSLPEEIMPGNAFLRVTFFGLLEIQISCLDS
jgi:hypothetical protein